MSTNNNQSFISKFFGIVKNNKLSTLLLLIMIVGAVWFLLQFRNLDSQRTTLITQYETKIDSLNIKHIEFSSEVFSWAVRSELLRDNVENLNQLLTIFIQKSGVDLVQIVNPIDKMVLISSDKRFEGNPYNGMVNINVRETETIIDSTKVDIVTPVMGFNNMIGVIIIEFNKKVPQEASIEKD